MKNNTKLYLTIVTSLTVSFSAFSQKIFKDAEMAYDAHQYNAAVEMYKEAYSKVNKTLKPYVLYKTGLASMGYNSYKAAEEYFSKAIAANFEDSEVYYQLGTVLKVQMKYPEAITEFNNYKSKGGDAKKADLSVKSCELAQQWVDNPMRYKVENMSFNSKARDYAPVYSDKKYQTLIISSNRDGARGSVDASSGANHSDLWETKLDKNGKWSQPVNLPEIISTEVNEGRAWVSKKGDMIFFTRCPELKDKDNKCGIYLAKKQGSGWGQPEMLPFENDSVDFRDACLSSDGKVLYFASKMSGGYGGADIWYCSYDAKSNAWRKKKNAGSTVNTPGSERYPSISDDGKKFYFSSNYHPGLGGMDIFMTEVSPDGKLNKPVENMKYPINSSYDDFAIVFEGKRNRGYLTSNRPEGKGEDDIYSFYLPPLVFHVKGFVYSGGDPNTGVGKGEAVEGVKVKLVGSDGNISEITTGKDGSYDFKIKEKNTYTLTTETGKTSKSASHSKEGFLANKDQKVVTTLNEPKSKDFIANFEALIPIVLNPRMPEVQYALGSAELLPQSKDSLNFLYNIMKDNPTTIVELNSHTDSRGDAAKNMKLSQDRAQSCVDYLVKEKGIDPARLNAKGYGKTMLLISDDVIAKAATKEEKEALHQKNRRTSFKILSFDFKDPNAPKNPGKPGKKSADDEDSEE